MNGAAVIPSDDRATKPCLAGIGRNGSSWSGCAGSIPGGFFKDERAYKQLAIVVQPLQVSGDPAEFLILLWSSRIVFNKANSALFLALDS